MHESNLVFTFLIYKTFFYYHLVFLHSSMKDMVVIEETLGFSDIYCCLSYQHILCQLHTRPKQWWFKNFQQWGYSLIIWNQINYFKWLCLEVLFQEYIENSSQKPYFDDKHKSQPHRQSANIITESQVNALHIFWNNQSFYIMLDLVLYSNGS